MKSSVSGGRISIGGRLTLYILILADPNSCYRQKAARSCSDPISRAASSGRRASISPSRRGRENYVELPEGYQAFPSVVGKLNKAIYGLVEVGRWDIMLTVDL